MKEILGFFSLATEGDTPVGLNSMRLAEKRNQPEIKEIKESFNFSFLPLFQQQVQFSVVDNNGDCLSEYDSGARWLSSISR